MARNRQAAAGAGSLVDSCAYEINVQVAAVRAMLQRQVEASLSGQSATISGSMRLRRNAAVHEFSAACTEALLKGDDLSLKRLQRVGSGKSKGTGDCGAAAGGGGVGVAFTPPPGPTIDERIAERCRLRKEKEAENVIARNSTFDANEMFQSLFG